MNIILSVVLVKCIGIAGVIIGTFCANLFRTIQFSVFVSKHILKRNILEVVRRVIWVIINSSIIVVMSLSVQNVMSFELNWIGWILQAMVVFSIACLVTIVTSLICYRKDFKRLLNMGVSVLKK